jgi:hypothetical protein
VPAAAALASKVRRVNGMERSSDGEHSRVD